MNEKPLRLGVVGDLHLASLPYPVARWHGGYDFVGLSGRLDAAVRRFIEAGVDAVCLLGDLTHGGSTASLEPLARALAPTRVPVLMVAGNHDRGRESLTRALPQARIASTEGESIAGWRIAGVHVATGGWFGATLEAPPAVEVWGKNPVVLLSHFPLHSYAQQMADRGMPYPGDLLGRQELAELLEARHAPTIVLSGHIHARASSGGRELLQIVNAALVEAPFECAIVEVTTHTVTRTAVSLDSSGDDDVTALAPAREVFVRGAECWLPDQSHPTGVAQRSPVGAERHRPILALPSRQPLHPRTHPR